MRQVQPHLITDDGEKRAFIFLLRVKACANAYRLHAVFQLASLPNDLLFFCRQMQKMLVGQDTEVEQDVV